VWRQEEAAGMGVEDDASRVREVLGGNLDAFGGLYDRYAGLIRAICHHEAGNDFHLAQDLCQEVFLRGYRNLPALKDHEKFAAWLVGIARMVCLERRRTRLHDRHRFVAVDPDQAAEAPEAPPREDMDRILSLIGELPEQERMALDLFYLHENSVEAARQILNLSRSGFYRLLERAEAHLRRRIENVREAER
jgi:RNA polymerase sigma-70 factor (ECF subfamily)